MRNADKKTKSEFGSQELKHSVEHTEVRRQRELKVEVGIRIYKATGIGQMGLNAERSDIISLPDFFQGTTQ